MAKKASPMISEIQLTAARLEKNVLTASRKSCSAASGMVLRLKPEHAMDRGIRERRRDEVGLVQNDTLQRRHADGEHPGRPQRSDARGGVLQAHRARGGGAQRG